MLRCEHLAEVLSQNDLSFFTGVPDSTFQEWLLFLEHQNKLQHVLACNETSAIAIASGYHLATGKVPVVYMQNSGLGNTVNPLTSLADKEVYSIPMVLFIGWRGEPGEKDEPQHKKMGRVMHNLLRTLEIPCHTLPDTEESLNEFWRKVQQETLQNQAPSAVIVRKKIFAPFSTSENPKNAWSLERESAIKMVVDALSGNEAIVSTTGKISRELFEYREELQQSHENDFYTVGSLGCAASIAAGIAISQPKRSVIVFDADGSALMHTGSWSTIAHYQLSNIKHIVFDNEAHESTGGQPSHSQTVDFPQIAMASGYHRTFRAEQQQQLQEILPTFLNESGPSMLLIKVKMGSRDNLGRPTTTPLQNKNAFMDFLRKPHE